VCANVNRHRVENVRMGDFLTLNVNGLQSKRTSLEQLLLDGDIHIAALQETLVAEAKLPGIAASMTELKAAAGDMRYQLRGYHMLATPRVRGVPGARGLFVLVDAHFHARMVHSSHNLQIIQVNRRGNSPLFVFNVYIPGVNAHGQNARRRRQLVKDIRGKVRMYAHTRKKQVVLMGDFNHTDREFVSLLGPPLDGPEDEEGKQVTHRQGGRLDFIFTNIPTARGGLRSEEVHFSDHRALSMTAEVQITAYNAAKRPRFRRSRSDEERQAFARSPLWNEARTMQDCLSTTKALGNELGLLQKPMPGR